MSRPSVPSSPPATPVGGSLDEVAADIRAMRIRGAGPLAVAAAQALGRHTAQTRGALEAVHAAVRDGARRLMATRPTAVSLRNALSAVAAPALRTDDADAARRAAATAAARLADEAATGTQRIAGHGADLLRTSALGIGRQFEVLTHCHSSTVIAVLDGASNGNRQDPPRTPVWLHVFADETRPFRQGLVTVHELARLKVPATLLVDSAAGILLRQRRVDMVVVGADTVASDGSVFNKVGTATVAQLAHDAGVPVYCATGSLKFTWDAPEKVVVEERAPAEVARPEEIPLGVDIFNPVFDRTPPDHIHAFITEHGIQSPLDAVARALRDVPHEVPW